MSAKPLVRLKPVLLRVYRAGLFLFLLFLIHGQAVWHEAQRHGRPTLRQARMYFPTAERVQLRDAERGLYIVTNSRRETVGALLRTSPFSDKIIGYSGPSDLLIALDPRGAIRGIGIIRSGDTPEYVRQVKESPRFLPSFQGWKPGEESGLKVDAVSGATLTSLAMVEAVQDRLAGAAPSLRFPEQVTLAEIQVLFTNAVRATPERARWKVFDRSNRLLGFALRTSPQGDNVSGYRGPSDSLAAIAPDGQRVIGFHIRKSFDTESYVDQVRRARAFSNLFVGKNVRELATLTYPTQAVDGVSGATMTARAVLESVQRRFGADLRTTSQKTMWAPKPRDWGLAAVILGAVAFSFTNLRGYWWARRIWQAVLIVYIGLVNHDFVSLALLGGWAQSGWVVKTAPSLVLLAAAAFITPWMARRHLYCHQICPHGAAQQWLGRLGQATRPASLFPRRLVSNRRLHISPSVSKKITQALEVTPGLLLGVALVAVLLDRKINLAALEPFDAWSWSTAGIATLAIAIVGLIASIFVSQAYCRFGCPTGALFRFIRSAGSADAWGRRDWGALALIGVAMLTIAASRQWPPVEPEPPPIEFQGRAMETTWKTKIRDEVADPKALEKLIQRELDWAESMTSSTGNADIVEFNRSATTNTMPMPWPVITLSRWAVQIGGQSDGAYDFTAVHRGGERRQVPSGQEADQIGSRNAGWKDIEILEGMLRKRDPTIQIDLKTLAKGWAIDHVAQVLERRGYTNLLIELGDGKRAQGIWSVELQVPTGRYALTNESLGIGQRNRQIESVLLDPSTGRPRVHQTMAVHVRHQNSALACAWAEALTKLEFESGMALADRLGLAAQFIVRVQDQSLKVIESARWLARRE